MHITHTEASSLIHIDGSRGEGGGQILRSALSLSVLLQRPLRLSRIRAGRAKPGLMRQHLACVQAAAQISAADVEGARLGSTELTFVPHALCGGSHHFAIGSAGSTTLVLQTVLPLLLCADQPSRLSIEGGTHNPMAPSVDFLQQAFLPQLQRMGADLDLQLERHGFFPMGGGRIVLQARPGRLQPLSLLERGDAAGIDVLAITAGLPAHIGLREATAVADHYGLRRERLQPVDLGPRYGTGNVLALAARFANVTEWVTRFGERGLRAEQVAERACRELDGYLAHNGAVGEHLADQLLLPLWLAGGGEFTTGAPSSHLQTNADVLRQFGAAEVEICPQGGHWRVSLKSLAAPGHSR
ncbi:MAG: RNA 3'-terminal phosphate cyclase [Xanthomonadales bacterium]|nr:RNA 3'-terminal phosphate cyclase [Xanthomonadales bacterium]